MSAPPSLRRRLLLAGAFGVLLAALAASWALGLAFERASLRGVDLRLADDLDRLIAGVDVQADGRPALVREPQDPRYDAVFSGHYWVLWDPDGEVRSSRSAWDAAPFDDWLRSVGAARRTGVLPGPRQQQLRVLGQKVRFDRSGRSLVLVVASDLRAMQEEVATFRWFAGAAVAALALALLAVVLWQVRFGLRPLREVGATLARIREGDDVRFDAAALPAEVAPLAGQVNELLDEHQRRVERARHAAQDLAHALKTPLSVLDLEAAGDTPVPAAAVRAHLQRMRAAVERHLVLQPGTDARQRTPVAPVVEALSALLARVHGARGVQLRHEVPPAALFAGSRDDLEEMLGNLLDNAWKWARTQATLVARVDGWRLRLVVEDDGPGLAPEQYDAALQRGTRLDTRTPGSGFGLAIVQQLAQAYGGALELGRSPSGGLRVELELPAAVTGP